MKRHISRFIITLLVVFICASPRIEAQVIVDEPFAELDRQVRGQQGGWAGSKQPLARLFNAERARLGSRFEAELLRYIGTDIKKHYWSASFLTASSYLHGNQPLPRLALRILQQGLSLLNRRTDEGGLCDVVRMSVNAARIAERLGLHAEASSHKNEAERLRSEESARGCFPGMNEADRDLYDSIRSDYQSEEPARPDCEPRPSHQVSAGVLDRRAISRPEPDYSSLGGALRMSGQLVVTVIVDETGTVIWACVVSGHPLLRPMARTAALRARFSPVMLSGRPVRVLGTLTYSYGLR